MIHKHIKSLPHHPKRVVIISLVVAVLVGFGGYMEINKKILSPEIIPSFDTVNSLTSHDLSLGFLAGGRIKTVSVKAGDKVKTGQVLAALDAGNTEGALSQAKAAYETAEANYLKVVNGATSSAIDVAKAAVNTAQVNLDGITKQQAQLVQNAHKNLLNSTPEALPISGNSDSSAPTISGNYNLDTEGQIVISVYFTGNGTGFSASGIVSGSGIVATSTPQPIGNSGLYIKFPSTSNISITEWTIDIPNKKASNYLTNYNAYQSALQMQSQAVAGAQALLDQAQASLAALVSTARPEDIAIAKAQVDNAAGAVQIALAAYNNTVITAPSDGTILSVAITPGQIATPNTPAIEFISN